MRKHHSMVTFLFFLWCEVIWQGICPSVVKKKSTTNNEEEEEEEEEPWTPDKPLDDKDDEEETQRKARAVARLNHLTKGYETPEQKRTKKKGGLW